MNKIMLHHKDIKILKNQSGISLIELILGIAIMLIILIPITTSLRAGIEAYQYNLSQSQNLIAGRQVLNIITDELRYATEINFPPPQTSATLTTRQINYSVPLVPPVPNAPKILNRTISISTGTPSTTSTLVVTHDGTVQKNITLNNLQSLTITPNGNQVIISIKFNNNSSSPPSTMDLSTTIIMQNL